MTRVKIQYAAAVVMALCAVTALVLCIVGRTFEGASAVVGFSAAALFFLVKIRVDGRIAARSCTRTSRS